MTSGSSSIGPLAAGVHELMRMVIESNNRRDEQVNAMFKQLHERLQTSASENGADASSTTQYSMIPDLNSSILPFDGETSDCGVATEWLNVIQTTARLHRWPDAYTVEAARSHLRGAARNWFLSRQFELKTWSQFKTAFEATFVSQMDKLELWRRASNRVQGPQESIHTYFHDKMRLCRRLELGAAEAKNYYV